LALAKQLSALDKMRLIERLAPLIMRELKSCRHLERESLRSLWRGLDASTD
jgi:hypothetical protein